MVWYWKQHCPECDRKTVKRGEKSRRQQYYCKHCDKWFSETYDSIFYRRHLSEDEILKIYQYILQKKTFNDIAKITGHHPDTIGRLARDTVIYGVPFDFENVYDLITIIRNRLKKSKKNKR